MLTLSLTIFMIIELMETKDHQFDNSCQIPIQICLLHMILHICHMSPLMALIVYYNNSPVMICQIDHFFICTIMVWNQLSIVAVDDLVLKHQVIGSHNAETHLKLLPSVPCHQCVMGILYLLHIIYRSWLCGLLYNYPWWFNLMCNNEQKQKYFFCFCNSSCWHVCYL